MEQWRIDNIVEMMYDKAIGEFKQWISDNEKEGDLNSQFEFLEEIIKKFRKEMIESIHSK